MQVLQGEIDLYLFTWINSSCSLIFHRRDFQNYTGLLLSMFWRKKQNKLQLKEQNKLPRPYQVLHVLFKHTLETKPYLIKNYSSNMCKFVPQIKPFLTHLSLLSSLMTIAFIDNANRVVYYVVDISQDQVVYISRAMTLNLWGQREVLINGKLYVHVTFINGIEQLLVWKNCYLILLPRTQMSNEGCLKPPFHTAKAESAQDQVRLLRLFWMKFAPEQDRSFYPPLCSPVGYQLGYGVPHHILKTHFMGNNHI